MLFVIALAVMNNLQAQSCEQGLVQLERIDGDYEPDDIHKWTKFPKEVKLDYAVAFPAEIDEGGTAVIALSFFSKDKFPDEGYSSEARNGYRESKLELHGFKIRLYLLSDMCSANTSNTGIGDSRPLRSTKRSYISAQRLLRKPRISFAHFLVKTECGCVSLK